MSWLQGSLQDGLRYAAERLIQTRLLKSASDSLLESAQQSQKARQQLGILGVPQDRLNNLVGAHRRGEVGDLNAKMQYTRMVPSIPEQLGNIPSAIGTALSHGNVGDALAQADVTGVKNIPSLMGLAGIGSGLATYGVANQFQRNADKQKLLTGFGGGTDHLKDILGNDEKALLERYRKALPPPDTAGSLSSAYTGAKKSIGDVQDAYRQGGISGATKNVGQQIYGAGSSANRYVRQAWNGPPGLAGPGPGGPKNPSGVINVSKSDLHRALANKYKADGRSKLPLLAALGVGSIPLMAKEWLMPGGYRSGRNPFNKLLETNNEMNDKKKKSQ